MNIISKFFLAILFVATSISFANAQHSTSSPYSVFGMGEISPNYNAHVMGMGGTTLAYRDGGYLNLSNPASLTALDSLQFTFNVGLGFQFSNLNQNGESDQFIDYNISQLALGFQISPRWSSAFAIKPYSSIGFDITKLDRVEGGTDYFYRTIEGTGGLNQVMWSNGVEITKDLSLGVNAGFIFGNNEYIEKINVQDGSGSYSSTTKVNVSDFIFDFALQYKKKLNDFSELSLGATYQPKAKIGGEGEMTVVSSGSGIGIPIYNDDFANRNFTVAEKFGFGLGYSFKNQLWIGADYAFQKWGDTEYLNQSDNFVDNHKVNFGFEYKANDGYARTFMKKMVYRFGGFYDSGYLKIENQNIASYGVSGGLGIPMANNRGMVNIGVQYGQTGTTASGLIREDFTRLTIDFTLFEMWFFKRKYD